VRNIRTFKESQRHREWRATGLLIPNELLDTITNDTDDSSVASASRASRAAYISASSLMKSSSVLPSSSMTTPS